MVRTFPIILQHLEHYTADNLKKSLRGKKIIIQYSDRRELVSEPHTLL